ncbi:MAG: hypothetical protein ACR2IL_08695 [Chitinophagaceae bacterium]
MSIKYTPATLKKFEELYEEIGFRIRFEKGNFQSGYCIIQDKKMAVVNKFLTLEGRINALIDILPSIEFDIERLSTEGRQFYDMAMAIPSRNA